MSRKKRLSNYKAFREQHDLRAEIQSALDRIAQNEGVFDIDVEDRIIGHSRPQHISITSRIGNVVRASIYTVDKYGKRAGCKIAVYAQKGYGGVENFLKGLLPRSEPGYT